MLDDPGYRDFVQSVKDANPIDSVVGEDAPLESAGRALKCCSPLRKDKDPSFYVYADQGSWWDFGTQEGGDVIEYVQRRYRISFFQAVDFLVSRSGMAPWRPAAERETEASRRAVEELSERRAVYGVMRDAFEFYRGALPDRIRRQLREQWGIEQESIERHRIGWAPGGTALCDYLLNECGRSSVEIERTGLAFKRAGGELRDFYQARIVFPYFVGGETVYSIGRRVEGLTPDDDWELGKYKKQLVRSERHDYVSQFVTNEWLFGEDNARRSVESLIVAEGVTDCVVAMQHGYPAVSFVTTRPNAKQRERLASLTSRAKQVVIANDSEENESGIKGALDTAEVIYRAGREVRVVQFRKPESQDKTDLVEVVLSGGKEALDRAVSSAMSFFGIRLEAVDPNLGTKEAEAEVRELCQLAATRGPIERDRLVGEISKKMKVARGTVSRVVGDFAPKTAPKELGLRGRVFESEEDCYYVETAPGNREFISNFSIRALEVLVSERGESLLVELRSRTGENETRVIAPSAWASRRAFVEAVGCSHRSFTGNDENVQAIRALLNSGESRPTVRRGTEVLGHHEVRVDGTKRQVWVTETGVFDASGPVDPQPLFYVPNSSSLERRFFYPVVGDDEVREIALQVLPRVMTLNELAVMHAVVGWFYAAPLAPLIQESLGHFPLLWMFGSAGTGKTTILREVLWPMSGAVNRNLFSVTDTEFALHRTLSGGRGIPVVFDEWRPSDMPRNATDRMNRLLRLIYNGSSVQRGQRDLSLRVWELSAPVAIAGEAPPEDPAILERSVRCTLDKNAINGARRMALEVIRRHDVTKLAGHYLRFALGVDFPKELTVARGVYSRIAGDLALPDRVRDNVLCVVLGLMLFERWSNSLGVTYGDEMDLTKTIREIALAGVEGGEVGFVKDSFDRFLESISTMAHRGVLIEGVHYSYEDAWGTQLNLHVHSCYQDYLQQQKSLGQRDETNGYVALKRVIREKSARSDSYVLGIERRTDLGRGVKSRIRVTVIDLAKLPKALDVTEFPRRGVSGSRSDEDAAN